MNVGCKEGVAIAKKLIKKLKKTGKKDYVILPSIQAIYFIKQKLNNNFLNFGAQDCSQFTNGAFTGDISASMISELGCKYVLIGHSERRNIYKEQNLVLKKKINNAFSSNLKVIFCVGEKLKEYKKSETKKIIVSQLDDLFDNQIDFKKLIIAYEPVWAIGSNKTPSLDEIKKVHGFIKDYFKKKYKVENICVIYGGSVNLSNSKSIFGISNVDGGLIGGASLKAGDFKEIYDTL